MRRTIFSTPPGFGGKRGREESKDALPLEWAGYIIRPTDAKCQPRDVPNRSGIYAWYSQDGDLLYIGRSVAMNSRLRDHHMPFWGGRQVSYRLVPGCYLAGVEMAHIKALEPSENMARESASLPFWDEISAAIERAWRDVLPEQRARVSARSTELAEQIAARL